MSKKKKILIILIIIIAIIGLITGIRAIKNFYILQNIFSEIEKNIQKDNYYLKTVTSYKGNTSITEIFYKDGVGKMIAENGVYTWVDGENAYMIDEDTRTYYDLDIQNAIGLVSNEMFASFVPGYSKNILERFIMVAKLNNSITTENINDKECYKIKIKENEANKTYWIEKSTNKPLRAKIEFINSDIYEYDYELQYNITKSQDVALPDLSEYQKMENLN